MYNYKYLDPALNYKNNNLIPLPI
uniref:Uncharacterized protein n=1 Tax=Rhizophora mucronata TaxID=61149 RepID=A0A2P2QY90_RHIMU